MAAGVARAASKATYNTIAHVIRNISGSAPKPAATESPAVRATAGPVQPPNATSWPPQSVTELVCRRVDIIVYCFIEKCTLVL